VLRPSPARPRLGTHPRAGERPPLDLGADINSIPMNFVERVEILKDGASATYGSDAIGGVVNFITRNEFEAWRRRRSTA